MKTMWRTAYGDMMTISHEDTYTQANHEENNIWTHDIKHVENVMQTMRRISYGHTISSMWRMSFKPYGGNHKEGLSVRRRASLFRYEVTCTYA